MKRTIEVTVSPKGDILIDAIGFKGADCEKATRFLEEVLGVVVQQNGAGLHITRGARQHASHRRMEESVTDAAAREAAAIDSSRTDCATMASRSCVH